MYIQTNTSFCVILLCEDLSKTVKEIDTDKQVLVKFITRLSILKRYKCTIKIRKSTAASLSMMSTKSFVEIEKVTTKEEWITMQCNCLWT